MTRWVWVLVVAMVAGCMAPDAQVPPFAKVPYQPFSRDAVVAIAEREWRLFGERVGGVDDGSKPERGQGYWQRIGEYWWLGQPYRSPESGWTGKHDGSGVVFPETEDGRFAWSAAFVSYVMRMAGAGDRFPYAPDHAEYINAARRGGRWIVAAERADRYAPQPGDLICRGRGWASDLTFDDLPQGLFPSHCDIVVGEPASGRLPVIGGNVDDAVAKRLRPVSAQGILTEPWLAVLRLTVRP